MKKGLSKKINGQPLFKSIFFDGGLLFFHVQD